jgi:arginyl-tRNA synthetase
MSELRHQLKELLREGVAGDRTRARRRGDRARPAKQLEHGDFATNVALQHAKALKKRPRDVAQALLAALPESDLVQKIEIAGPGFINIFVTPSARQAVVRSILAEGERFGRGESRRGERVMVEFVSANPTDRCTSATAARPRWATRSRGFSNGRARRHARVLLQRRGPADREPRGVRARASAGDSGRARELPEDGYRGAYIKELAQRYLDEVGHDLGDIDSIRRFAVAELRREQDRDLLAFGVRFDNYFLESSLYSDGRVESIIERLVASGKTYEADGALWLRTTDFGDDKDRVMRKSDGGYTYFVPDVAYHVTKWERGFGTVINVQGSDHHSTITRVRAGLQATGLGIPQAIRTTSFTRWSR